MNSLTSCLQSFIDTEFLKFCSANVDCTDNRCHTAYKSVYIGSSLSIRSLIIYHSQRQWDMASAMPDLWLPILLVMGG